MKKVVSFLKKNQKMILMLLAIIVVIYFILPMVMEPFENSKQEEEQEEEVQGNDNADISKSQPALVLFHSKTCQHCIKMMPEWSKVKEQLKDTVEVIEKEANDITDEETKLHKISGYPTIKYCPDGLKKPSVEHDGERTAESIVEFVDNQQ